MKRRIAIFAAPIMSLMFSVSSFGAVLTFNSDGTEKHSTFLSGANTVDETEYSLSVLPAFLVSIDQPLAWSTTFTSGAAAKWISYTPDGQPTTLGGTGEGSGNISNLQYMDFFRPFNVSSASNFKLEVMADDRANTYLIKLGGGGVTQILTSPELPGQFCNSIPTSCTSLNQGNYSSVLASGNYALGFRVFQDNGTGFGLAYNATLSDVPEPGSYALISMGLGGLLIALKRRQKGTEN